MKSFSESYKAAGVDITAGYAAVELMKQHVARTMTPGAIGGLGGFGGLFELDMTGLTHPVLVSGTDGVGTKLKIAFLMDKHDTVGIDCVAMCANDVFSSIPPLCNQRLHLHPPRGSCRNNYYPLNKPILSF